MSVERDNPILENKYSRELPCWFLRNESPWTRFRSERLLPSILTLYILFNSPSAESEFSLTVLTVNHLSVHQLWLKKTTLILTMNFEFWWSVTLSTRGHFSAEFVWFLLIAGLLDVRYKPPIFVFAKFKFFAEISQWHDCVTSVFADHYIPLWLK